MHRPSWRSIPDPRPWVSIHAPSVMDCIVGLERESMEDVSVVFQDAICCLPMPELLAFIRLHEAGSGQSQDPSLKLAHGTFGFGKHHSNRTDGMHLGLQMQSLKSQLRMSNEEDEMKISILTVGKSPAVGSFEATVHGSKQGALALIGRLASSVTLGFSSAAWRGGKHMLRGSVRSWWSGNKEEELPESDPTALMSSLRDNKRHVERLTIAPRGCLAVMTDNLGRVMLMDTQKSIIIRIWKGYRDAQCAWIVHRGEIQLVIYGWRRETLEVWPMRYGPRSASLVVGQNCRLLPTSPPMGMGDEHSWNLRCGVLDVDNEEIWDVAERAFPDGGVTAIWDMMLTHPSR